MVARRFSKFCWSVKNFPGAELDLLTARADIGKHFVDSKLVNRLDSAGRQSQAHPAVLARHPETMMLKIGLKSTLRLVIRVRNVIARHGLLPGYLTSFCHYSTPPNNSLYRNGHYST